VESEGIVLPTGTIKALPIGSTYKYLGVLEAEEFQHNEVKSKVREIYKQRLHLRADVDHLYVTHKSSGKGLLSISDVVALELTS